MADIKTLKDVRKDNGISSLFPKLKTVTLNKDGSISVKGKYIGDKPVAICYPDS